jgi:2-oxoisovalerate dehydrogenase E1 component
MLVTMNKRYDTKSLVKTMVRIRSFEQALLELFSQGKLFGTTHTCIGQEACAAALYANVDPQKDVVFSNHRCHGHFLAFGGSMYALMAEIMGKRGALCGGRGGSQHLCDGNFFSQGVQGQSMPIAVGYAYQMSKEATGGIVVSHIGDGTLGQGVVYEATNIASLLSVPLLVILEHNGVAQSTDTSTTTAGDIEMRFKSFGIETDRRNADDPLILADHLSQVVAYVRQGRPFVQILDTFRLMAHSKGDDSRPEELIQKAWKNDWLSRQVDKDPAVAELMKESEVEVRRIINSLDKEPMVELGRAEALALPDKNLFESSQDIIWQEDESDSERPRINKLLNRALDRILSQDQRVMLIGEDLADPYGGAFKVTQGLSSKYGNRILSSPISEAAIVGFSIGVAMRGGRPIAEIMFGDFTTLATDQLLNQAAKMFFMYNEKMRVPITVRIISGGYRGYGPTHSQSLEGLFCGFPGLKVVALSRRINPRAMLEAAVADPNPVLFVENKTLYAQRPLGSCPRGFRFIPSETTGPGDYPPLVFSSTEHDENADITVVTYGGLTDMVEETMEKFIIEEELEFDYIILSQLSPLHIRDILLSVSKTGRLLVIEEGHKAWGVGSKILAAIAESMESTGLICSHVGAKQVPIPNARNLEQDVLPSVERISRAITEMFRKCS